jgi:hypothetical protein
MAVARAKGRLVGDAHPDTLLARELYAESLRELGDYQLAAAVYGAIAERRESSLGIDHPDTRRVRDRQAAIRRQP